MIEVSRLKDLNAAKLFLGFRIGAVSRRDFAVFPVQGQRCLRRLKRYFGDRGRQSSRLCRFSSTGSTLSPEAEEVLRRQGARWRADGRCTQSIRRTLRVARPRSSLRIFLARGIPSRCISSIPPGFPVTPCFL